MNPHAGAGNSFLCCYDGSDESKLALDKALNLAHAKLNDEIYLCHILKNDHPNPEEANFTMEILSEAQQKCEEKGIHVNLIWEEGNNIGEKIIELGVNHSIDYIVIGSRGYGGIIGKIMGSVSKYVVEHANRTVIIVRN
eukprot:TRINITY_DN79277_c0_g1_i1.p1 TRINITY_DN79277_c0_g1~~TRINITY_DN79277_c0_g1_i1.p1  ORF type:complete len:139 (+),score=20.33 TRINITY_DN79277_c0_g1_i1:25-441(+)